MIYHSKNNKTMKTIYFISIDSNNLGLYFSSAIITPHKYIKEPVEDIQSLNKNCILLSDKKFSNKSDCCLEVVLTENEEHTLISNNKSCYLLCAALPISRISAIYFYSKEKMENIIDLSRSSSFIPARLVKLIDKLDDDFFKETICVFENANKVNDISYQIDLYNKYLGGFAFMKIGGEAYMNYSKNYFSTLAFFNNTIKEKVNQVDKMNSLDLDYKYQGLFNTSDNEWDDWRKFVFGSHNDIVSEIGNKVQTKNGVYQQNDVSNNKKLYILSVLANYGSDLIKPKKTESLLFSLISDGINYKEAISLFFGLNIGYRKLKKSYFIESKNWSIKFELASQLDYYTIEGIFQFLFNGIYNADLSFLKEIIPDNSKTKIDKNIYRTYRMFDEDIIYEKKPSTIKDIFNLFKQRKFFGKILSSITGNFAQKNDITLSDEQNKIMQFQYFSILDNPINEYLSQLENKVSDFYNEKVTELQQKFNSLKQENAQISVQLKKADETLFDEIDSNGDGELSQQEIGIFMDKIIASKKQLELKALKVSEKTKAKRFSSEYARKSNLTSIVEEQKTEYTDGNYIIKVHRYYLNKLSITELGKVAKSKNIVSTQKHVNKNNSKEIIEKILEYIKSDKKLI